MKLIRFGIEGREKPGILSADGRRKDCSEHFPDWNHGFFQSGGLERLRELICDGTDGLPDVPERERWGACVARPGKVIGIGLNYRDHAEEAGMPVPLEPIVFLKGSNTVVGPHDPVMIPRGGLKTDWEVELGVVIGKNARYLETAKQAADHVAGFCISNDVSERSFQLERAGQWTKGKSCDTFNPIGPFMATADEVPNVNTLHMTLRLNDELKQDGNTRTMIFDSYFLVHYLSQFMTLEAGDLITTGTPPGVGMGRKPPQFLKAGDRLELSIEGLGTQRQVCVDA